eukprot:comp16925_c0_seq1/m.15489 comp16925_c0_seq1/g.15489  ORF comp16925_c0_seq1/g.15489 comp16925_c0_seq1/m.15489 type:complete len:402 (-) comp16925_c0_seq1:304-1509(-)
MSFSQRRQVSLSGEPSFKAHRKSSSLVGETVHLHRKTLSLGGEPQGVVAVVEFSSIDFQPEPFSHDDDYHQDFDKQKLLFEKQSSVGPSGTEDVNSVCSGDSFTPIFSVSQTSTKKTHKRNQNGSFSSRSLKDVPVATLVALEKSLPGWVLNALWSLMVATVAAGCALGMWYLYEGNHLTKLLEWLQTVHPAIGFVAFVPLFFLVSLPVSWGYIVLNFGAGYLWGLWTGQAIVMASAAIGTWIATLLCRYTFRSWAEGHVRTKPVLQAVLSVMDGPDAFKIVALTRLSPFPYGLQNGMFALTSMPMVSYMTATVIGCFPTQLLNTYMGTTLQSVADIISGGSKMDPATWALCSAQIVVGCMLTVFVAYTARLEFNKKMQQVHQTRSKISKPSIGREVEGGH